MNRMLCKHFLWSALAACLGLGILLPSVNAEKKEDKKAKPTEEVKAAEEGAKSVEAIATAHRLIAFGLAGDENEQDAVKLTRAEALVLGARILKQNPLETLNDVPEGAAKADPVDAEKEIDGLLKAAKALSKGDKTLAELIDRVQEGARGLVGGRGCTWDAFTVPPGKSVTINAFRLQGKNTPLQYVAGAPASVKLSQVVPLAGGKESTTAYSASGQAESAAVGARPGAPQSIMAAHASVSIVFNGKTVATGNCGGPAANFHVPARIPTGSTWSIVITNSGRTPASVVLQSN